MSRLLVFLISLFALQAQAATYYVSTSGSDSNACTSTGSPCATLSGAHGKASDSDTVLLNRGDTWTPSARYTINKQIIIDAYGTGNKPIINGASASNIVYQGLLNIQASNVTVKNIKLTNSQGSGVSTGEAYSNIVIDSVDIDTTYDVGIFLKAGNSTVKNCTLTKTNNGFKNPGTYPTQGQLHPWGGVISVKGSAAAGFVIEDNTVYEAWGEGVAMWYGARDGIVRRNIIFASHSIGIYFDSAHDIDVYDNLIYGTTNTAYHRNTGFVGQGIALNNEKSRYKSTVGDGGGSGNLDLPDMTSNLNIYNNLVAFTEAGIGIWGQLSVTNYQNVKIFNNTFVGNKTQVSILQNGSSGHNLNNVVGANTYISNNVFIASGADSTNPISGFSSGNVILNNNAWGGSGGIAGTNDIAGSITLAKASGWQSLSALGDITSADFIISSSNVSGTAEPTILSAQGVTTDHNGTALNSPPDVGAIVFNGSGGTPPPSTTGMTLNSGTNTLTPSAINTFAGLNFSGAVSALLVDSDSNQVTSQFYTKIDGTGGQFLTSDLSGINTADFKVRLTQSITAPVYYQEANTTTWAASSGSPSKSAGTPVGPFSSALNIIGTTTNSALEGIVVATAPSAGSVIDVEADINPGTASTLRVGMLSSSGNYVRYNGSFGSGSLTDLSLGHSGYTYEWENMGTYWKLKLHVIADAAGDYTFQIGTGSTTNGLTNVVYSVRAWLDRILTDQDFAFTTVTPPSISSVNAGSDELVVNAENTILGTNLDLLTSINLSNSGGSIDYPVIGKNTSAKFRVADLTSLDTGAVTLTATYGNVVWADYNPRLWSNRSATRSDIAPALLGMDSGERIASTGADWNGTKVVGVFSALAGEQVTLDLFMRQGSSGNLRIAVNNATAATWVDVVGAFGGVLSSTGYSAATSAPTITQIYVEGAPSIVRIQFTAAADGTYDISVGPYSTTGDVEVYGGRAIVGTPTATVTHTVIKASTGTPEPTLVKKLKLGTPLSKITRNGVPANFKYTSVKVYDKNPATDRTAQVLVELVGPYNVGLQEYEGISVVDGIASATEADVLVGSGSLNALANGTYWVLSSRPSNGTLAISLTNIQLVTE